MQLGQTSASRLTMQQEDEVELKDCLVDGMLTVSRPKALVSGAANFDDERRALEQVGFFERASCFFIN